MVVDHFTERGALIIARGTPSLTKPPEIVQGAQHRGRGLLRDRPRSPCHRSAASDPPATDRGARSASRSEHYRRTHAARGRALRARSSRGRCGSRSRRRRGAIEIPSSADASPHARGGGARGGVKRGNNARHVLAETPGPAFVLAIGDDRTDDDLLRAVRQCGPTIQVGVRVAHQAGHQMATPGEVRGLLRRFVTKLRRG